jgi:hypothetical protein
MLKNLTAVAFAAFAAAACSVDSVDVDSEDLGTLQQEINTCSADGLEWKPFLAHLAYDAAEDFGRWEFTTDLYVNNGRLAISQAGYDRCNSRGRWGCPAMTAGLSAQDGGDEVRNTEGRVIMNPMTIRANLVAGFEQQKINEQNQGWLSDPSETGSYQTFQSATTTGLPHSVQLTNCAATIYEHGWYGGKSMCLRVGSYRMSDLAGIGNDALSSIKVRSGMKVTVFEHDGFAGASQTYTSDQAFTSTFNDQTSSLRISQDNVCSAIDSYKVTVSSGDWTKIRSKLVTLGYLRGNDLLDVRIDLANQVIHVDPFNVDFIPPSQIGGTTYGVKVKSATAETWRSTDDPSPAILPVGASCKKQPYGSTGWYNGIVKSSGAYRYCYLN